MSHLFDPITQRSVTYRNRIGVSPMCQYSCEDGFATDWHLVHLGSRAVGGAGLVMAEATGIEARGRITPNCLGIWSDAHIEPLARKVRFIKQHGAVAGIQLAHAGRKAGTAKPWAGGKPLTTADGGWEPVGASAAPFAEGYRTPHMLSVDEIKQVQQAFVDAASRADAAGFDMIELHAAHGYLLHSFYSPLGNTRADAYGGSFENRIRMVMETATALRNAWPQHKPLWVRISASDWVAGGWDLAQSIELCKRLKMIEIDTIDCSSGGNSPAQQVAVGPGYQTPFAEAIRRDAAIATAAVGMITAPVQADEIVRNSRADFVLLARELLRDPYWPIHAARALGVQDLPAPNPYARAL